MISAIRVSAKTKHTKLEFHCLYICIGTPNTKTRKPKDVDKEREACVLLRTGKCRDDRVLEHDAAEQYNVQPYLAKISRERTRCNAAGALCQGTIVFDGYVRLEHAVNRTHVSSSSAHTNCNKSSSSIPHHLQTEKV